ncbi:hypothetical protein SSX86_008382 [Deinandra increscens subsp. villosa]|uniref:Uncharacterized protein n=1 Tax=Deinandra increscens subsp. villosa TaxID=3103831 RepID=A0AAP0D305_9ASTR
MAAANAPITMKEALTQEILRAKKELDGKNIDYEATMTTKLSISKKIFDLEKDLILNSDSFKNFLSKNEEWLKPYVAFCFLRDFFETSDHSQWGTFSQFSKDRMKLIQASLQQQQKLQNMSAYAPSYLPEREKVTDQNYNQCSVIEEPARQDHSFGIQEPKEEALLLPKEKKGRGSAPLWYITATELESLSSYMRGRLTLDKINAAISDMAAYAEANAQLIKAPRKKLTESTLEKALCMFRNGLTHKIHERLSE